ncbi:MAG TPA: TOBE domain-containing protein [Terriglobales bacterium]|jgi:molybdate transport system regulatory protein
MRTSARNAFPGTITKLKKGAVNAEIELTLTPGERIIAIITNGSVDALALQVGSKATALIKASWIILGKDLQNARLSTRNIMPGTVQSVQEGAVNSEVTLKLDAGTLLTAIITNRSVVALGMKPGDEAFAAFKASHVILAVE